MGAKKAGGAGGVVASLGTGGGHGGGEPARPVALGVTLQGEGAGGEPSGLGKTRPDCSDQRLLAFPHPLATDEVPR